jgi:acyl-coenzyme A synthetase/AMP-(fatty) acid ligase
MINLLTQFSELTKYDLSSLEALAYGGSSMAPELIHRTREVLPNVKLIQGYGLSEAGFLTGLQDHEHTGDRLLSCGRTCPGIDMQVVDESGKEVGAGRHGELVARGANVTAAIGIIPKKPDCRSDMGYFVRETSAIGTQTGISTS